MANVAHPAAAAALSVWRRTSDTPASERREQRPACDRRNKSQAPARKRGQHDTHLSSWWCGRPANSSQTRQTDTEFFAYDKRTRKPRGYSVKAYSTFVYVKFYQIVFIPSRFLPISVTRFEFAVKLSRSRGLTVHERVRRRRDPPPPVRGCLIRHPSPSLARRASEVGIVQRAARLSARSLFVFRLSFPHTSASSSGRGRGVRRSRERSLIGASAVATPGDVDREWTDREVDWQSHGCHFRWRHRQRE